MTLTVVVQKVLYQTMLDGHAPMTACERWRK